MEETKGNFSPDTIVLNTVMLRQKSNPTSYEECNKIGLFSRLKVANGTAWCKGAGLAAVQIGIYLRAAWYIVEDREHCLVNPVIISRTGKMIVGKEGCLSIPDVWLQTERYARIVLEEDSTYGTRTQRAVSGFEALICQHEIDHMNGLLIFNRQAQPVKKIGRNELCPCGSGKKYKRCCIDKSEGDSET